MSAYKCTTCRINWSFPYLECLTCLNKDKAKWAALRAAAKPCGTISGTVRPNSLDRARLVSATED